MPMILTGQHALFSEQAYLYALKKGIILYGLSGENLNVHGGLFKRPIEVFIHDQTHLHEILTPNPKEPISCKVYERAANIVKEMASKFYDCINNPTIFKSEDKKK